MTLWLFLGIVVGASFFWFATQSPLKMKWYEWILAVLSAILVLFAIQNFVLSQTELEPRAANYLALLFGLPGVIIGLIPLYLGWRRMRSDTS
jgi:hypothetical protein